MNIKLHIERLILVALPVSSHDGPRVKRALQAELTRLLRARGLSDEFQTCGAVAAVPVHPIRFEEPPTPEPLGRQIARSVYGGLGSE
jgi:hypothetical protein